MDEDEEILKLRPIKWQTNLSKQIDKFSAIISDDKVFEKYFGEKYVEKLASKSKELTRTNIKLGVAYLILMLSLFASQNINDSGFELFGYGFKNIGHYKELLLLLASTITPITAVLSAYQKYIAALIKECLKKLSPDASIRQFYSYTYVDDYSDGITSKNIGTFTIWHGFTKFMSAALVLTLIFLFLTFIAGSFFIQINVIYDVATKPDSPSYINLFVITFAIASILFSWLVSFIQLPMPEVDINFYSKLSNIKDANPNRYQEVMKIMAKENAKKSELSTIVLTVFIYIATFAGIAMYWFPSSLNNLSNFLGKAVPGAFVAMFVANEIIKDISMKWWKWFFRKYSDESEYRTRIFNRTGKILLLIKLLIPFFISAGYSFYVLPPN